MNLMKLVERTTNSFNIKVVYIFTRQNRISSHHNATITYDIES